MLIARVIGTTVSTIKDEKLTSLKLLIVRQTDERGEPFGKPYVAVDTVDAGIGDLVLTATGDLSRNRKVGQLLAQGLSLQQAVASLGHVAEGVYSARTVVQRARALGIEMPISEAVVALLEGQLQPAQAVAALMGRDPKDEAL